jgi:glycosyltransferase involved in cell wall biosynthesis
MQATVSVILCTHNPRPGFFHRVLESLQRQTLPLAEWEFLLVDNASNQALEEVWDISWHPGGRHIREDELGLTPARLRGIREAFGGLLVFVDDDNILAPDFIEQARSISARYPFLGVFGAGSLLPEFEIPPPAELLDRVHLLAVRSVPSVVWSNNAADGESIPWGAGLCVTRQIATQYLTLVENLNVTAVLGRRGQRLFSGEDDVFSWASARGGQGFGLFPELRLTHLIWAGRLNQLYFVRLIEDHTFSHAILRYLLAGVRPKRIEWARYLHLVLHRFKNGQFSMRCQWAALRGEESATRFIDKNRLHPIDTVAGFGQTDKSANSRMSNDATPSSTSLPCISQK